MAAALAGLGQAPFRAKQLWRWIYNRGATDFAAMTDLGKPLRGKLTDAFVVERPTVARAQESADGTRKWLLRMADGQEVEAVHIPEDDRGALCVSSQVGCTLTCRFCHTGTQRLARNLEAAEVLGQVMHARDALGEWGVPHAERLFTNIVMMGMGEPLYRGGLADARRRAVSSPPAGFCVTGRPTRAQSYGAVGKGITVSCKKGMLVRRLNADSMGCRCAKKRCT